MILVAKRYNTLWYFMTFMKRTLNIKYLIAASIALITSIVYLASLKNEFVWDDILYITENPHIRSFNVELFRWAFFDFYASNWHPLTWISHASDYALWGLNPTDHRLTNIILHAINTLFVFFLVTSLLESYRERTVQSGHPLLLHGRSMLMTGGITAALFGLHPAHVESVAWIAERKDLLCTLFFLLSIGAYIKYVKIKQSITQTDELDSSVHPFLKRGRRGLKRHYLLSLAFFILALLSKPMAVSLPAVLLILDWHPFERIKSFKTFLTVFAEKLPFVALSIILSILTIKAQKTSLTPLLYLPLESRALVAGKSFMVYLLKMIFPLHLTPFYPYPQNISLSLEYLGAIAMFIGITTASAVAAKNQKLWLSVWCYYVVTLIPVIGIIQVGSQSMADRYIYLPSIGPFLIMGFVAAWVYEKVNMSVKWEKILRIIITFALILVFVSLSCLTFKQIGIWKNGLDLWSYVIEQEPGKIPPAYYNRGNIFAKRGLYDKAIEDYNSAIKINPGHFKSYTNRGIVYALTGKYDKAMADFNKGILLNNNDAEAFLNRGTLYQIIGNQELAKSDLRTACDLGSTDGCERLNLLTN